MSRRWPAATLVALVLACASPTLPLPPPAAPTVEYVDSEHVTLTGACYGAQPNAQISVTNDRLQAEEPDAGSDEFGVPTSSCGSWSETVPARSGDELIIQQEVNYISSYPLYLCLGMPGNECPPQ